MPRLRWMSLLLAIVVVIAVSTGVVWYRVRNGDIAPALVNDLRKLVRQYPDLKSMHDQALRDGRITLAEAEAIVKAAEASRGTLKQASPPERHE